MAQKQKIQSGFTLVELLVSIAVFVIFLGVVSNSYVTIVRGQREANVVRRLYAETRSALNIMEEELRLSSIDYNCYGQGVDDEEENSANVFDVDSLQCPPQASIINGFTDTLALINRARGEKTFLLYDATAQILLMQKFQRNDAGWIPFPGYEEPRPILGTDVAVKKLAFNLFPGVNPYSDDDDIYLNNTVQFQPQVRVFVELESRQEDLNVRIPGLNFQTTYSSRIYE